MTKRNDSKERFKGTIQRNDSKERFKGTIQRNDSKTIYIFLKKYVYIVRTLSETTIQCLFLK